MKQPAVYIMASKKNGTIYIGVTSNLVKRVYEHKNSVVESFTSRYQCYLLVHYQVFDNMEAAITVEKKLKKLLRAQKIKLIERENPKWIDLYETII